MNTPMEPHRPQYSATLNDYLSDLADEVQAVDLSSRVRTSSRRLAVRRTVLTSSALAAVIAVGSGVAWAGLPQLGRTGDPSVGSSSTAPATAPATGTPSPSASAAWNTIPAKLYYFTFDGKRYHMRVSSAGGVVEVLATGTPACGITVSPDHTRVAWIEGTDGGGDTGDLAVANIDGTGERIVLPGVSCMGGTAPFWTPDSTHMVLRQGNRAPRTLVDVRTGTVGDTPLANVQGYVAWSPNGRYFAYGKDKKIIVARPDGTIVRSVGYTADAPWGLFSVQGVSDDGGRAVIGGHNTDPQIVRTGYQLVDLRTGKNIALPAATVTTNKHETAIYPAPGDRVLVRTHRGSTHTLYLLDKTGKILDQRVEPAALSSATLLFTPTR